LKDIHFPKDAIIGAAVRNDRVIIPDGETVILPGDRVIIFAKRKSVPSVEKALTVKLEYF
jgi:trk system potassium uptake protein TrkA